MTDILAVSCGMQALSAVQQASGEGVNMSHTNTFITWAFKFTDAAELVQNSTVMKIIIMRYNKALIIIKKMHYNKVSF